MSATFTDDDVGKPVEGRAGEPIGVVAAVEGDRAHVRPNADAIDGLTSSIGWEGVADEPRPLEADDVSEITDEVVRLEYDSPFEGAPKDVTDDRQDRGLEVDPTDLADAEGVRDVPAEFSVEPDQDVEPTDAAVDPDAEPDHTDAAVDPSEQSRRTDPEGDSDAVRDPEPADGRATTDDARREPDGSAERDLDEADDERDDR